MKSEKKYTGKFLVMILTLSLFTIINSCKKDDNQPANSGTPPANEVWMQSGNSFNPGTITVSVNTTITWRNKDSVTHTVTSNSGVFDSGSVGANGTYSHQFTTAGTFPYHCTIHSGMTGTVVVQ